MYPTVEWLKWRGELGNKPRGGEPLYGRPKENGQAFHRKMLLEMIGKSFELMNKLEDEEARIFEEYQYKLKKAEYERLVEEGIIEAEL